MTTLPVSSHTPSELSPGTPCPRPLSFYTFPKFALWTGPTSEITQSPLLISCCRPSHLLTACFVLQAKTITISEQDLANPAGPPHTTRGINLFVPKTFLSPNPEIDFKRSYIPFWGPDRTPPILRQRSWIPGPDRQFCRPRVVDYQAAIQNSPVFIIQDKYFHHVRQVELAEAKEACEAAVTWSLGSRRTNPMPGGAWGSGLTCSLCGASFDVYLIQKARYVQYLVCAHTASNK